MSVFVKIDHSRRSVITRFAGQVTDPDVRSQVERIEEGGPYERDYSVITDFTEVTSFEVTTEMIRLVAARPSPLGLAKRVIVAPRDVEFGVSRMFQILSEKTRPDITVVRSMSEARALLELPEDNHEPMPQS